MSVQLDLEVWVAYGGGNMPYERFPLAEAEIGSYELTWQVAHPDRAILRCAKRWSVVDLDETLVTGERVEPVLPLVRVDVYANDTLVWRGWAVEERYVSGEWHYEVWGLARIASLTTVWTMLIGVESVDEAFLSAMQQILQAWDGGRTAYTLHANCPKRMTPMDYREGISGSALIELLQTRAPRHFILEGEWDGRWGVRFLEPKNFAIIAPPVTIEEQSLRMHTVRNRVQIIGATDYEAGRYQLLRNPDLTSVESVKSPRDLILDPHCSAIHNTSYWSLAQNVVTDAELGGGYTGNTFARFTASSNCRLRSSTQSVIGYEGLTWRARAAFRKGEVVGNAQVVMMIMARDPVHNQTTTLWLGNLTLTDEQEWRVLESPPVSPRPGYTQMWLEIESAGGNCNGVRIDAIHLMTSGKRVSDWQTLRLSQSTENYGYADPHANAGRYGLDGGAQVWLEPGWMFGQKVRRPDGVDPSSATAYFMLWYTQGEMNNQPIEPEVVLWMNEGYVLTGDVLEEGNFESTGTIRWRLYRWQNIVVPDEFWVGLWSEATPLWGISVWGAWFAFEPIEDSVGYLSAGNFGQYWANGYRTGYRPHTDLGFALTAWMNRAYAAFGERYARYNDEDAGRTFEFLPEAWRLHTQVVAEPYRQLRVSGVLKQVEQLQPHRYFWRVGLYDYFVGSLTLSSDGRLEASLHEPEADLIRALRRIL